MYGNQPFRLKTRQPLKDRQAGQDGRPVGKAGICHPSCAHQDLPRQAGGGRTGSSGCIGGAAPLNREGGGTAFAFEGDQRGSLHAALTNE